MNTETASYKELKEFIKKKRAENEEYKEFFGDYTHSSTEDLRELVLDFFDYYSDEKELEEEEETFDQQISETTPIQQAISLINQALEILENFNPENNEIADLHKKAMEIEFELQNID